MSEINEYVDSAFMQKKFLNKLRREKFDLAFEYVNVLGNESDILALKNFELYEYEFKIGESDFRKDINKNRHAKRFPHYFYYVVSDLNIIKGNYLNYAGIYLHRFSIDGQSLFRLIKEPLKIITEDVSREELYLLLRRLYNSKRNG